MFWKTKKKLKDHKNIIGLTNTKPILFPSRGNILIPISKGILCFLFVVGGLCGFVSCFTEEFNLAIILPLLFVFSMIIAFVKNSARNSLKSWIYILFLIAFIYYMIRFYVYVNSGYHALVNLCYAALENYLKIPALVHYNEIIENPYVTITYFIVFCGILGLLLMHMFISEHIRIWDVLLLNFLPFIIPLFVRLTPNVIYIAILLTAYIALMIINSRPYVKNQIKEDPNTHSPKEYYGWFIKPSYMSYQKHNIWTSKIPGFAYAANGITYLYTILVSLVIAIIVLLIVNVFMPITVFNRNVTDSQLKQEVTDDVEYFVTFGLSGIFNRYRATGGLSDGKLGGIYSVRPDYETDLKVRFVPVSSSPVYLRGYVGIGYTDKQWYNPLQLEMHNMIDHTSATLLYNDCALIDEYAYLDEVTSYLKPSTLQITNVDANMNYTYAPYYTNPTNAYEINEVESYTSSFARNRTKTLSFYSPYNTNTPNKYLENDTLLKTYLQVPSTTRDEIIQFLIDNDLNTLYISKNTTTELNYGGHGVFSLNVPKEQLLSGDALNRVINNLSDVLTNDFTYSLNPGLTPANRDFVGHFLNGNKKGFCAHFATASTLILRTLGIPARYVEGYVLTTDELSKATIVEDANVSDFIDSSFISLGDYNQVLDVEIADDKAHAWVEYYDPDFGWRVFEATTAAMDTLEIGTSFWNSLFGLMQRTNSNNNDIANNTDEVFSTSQFNKVITNILIGCIITVAFCIMLYYAYRYIKQYRSYHRNRRNINVRNYYKIVVGRIKRKYPEFEFIISIKEQLLFIKAHYPISKRINESSINKLANILERAAFSNEEVTYIEGQFALNSLKLIRRNILISFERLK